MKFQVVYWRMFGRDLGAWWVTGTTTTRQTLRLQCRISTEMAVCWSLEAPALWARRSWRSFSAPALASPPYLCSSVPNVASIRSLVSGNYSRTRYVHTKCKPSFTYSVPHNLAQLFQTQGLPRVEFLWSLLYIIILIYFVCIWWSFKKERFSLLKLVS